MYNCWQQRKAGITFALRGYDSIQLAAAFEAGRVSQSPIFFASFDTRLNKAARLLGMLCS